MRVGVPPKLGEGKHQVPDVEVQDMVLVVPSISLDSEGAVLAGDLGDYHEHHSRTGAGWASHLGLRACWHCTT